MREAYLDQSQLIKIAAYMTVLSVILGILMYSVYVAKLSTDVTILAVFLGLLYGLLLGKILHEVSKTKRMVLKNLILAPLLLVVPYFLIVYLSTVYSNIFIIILSFSVSVVPVSVYELAKVIYESKDFTD